jgi:hypothetical protein
MYPRTDFVDKVQRTWTQLLVEYDDLKEVAAIAVDTKIQMSAHHGQLDQDTWATVAIIEFHIPTFAYGYVKTSEHVRSAMERAMSEILLGRSVEFWEEHWGEPQIESLDTFEYRYLVRLINPSPNWQQIVRSKIESKGIRNQGVITSLAFDKNGRTSLTYNEMTFASQSEIRIAQELERRKVLFFPLPLAVRADTGDRFKDHREVDFLVCNEGGVWGILEVSYHPDRFEKDKEKDYWYKESGILCIEHYSAERCYERSEEVVAQFLSVLAKYRK